MGKTALASEAVSYAKTRGDAKGLRDLAVLSPPPAGK